MFELFVNKGTPWENELACLIVLLNEQALINCSATESRGVIEGVIEELMTLPSSWRREICMEVLGRCK